MSMTGHYLLRLICESHMHTKIVGYKQEMGFVGMDRIEAESEATKAGWTWQPKLGRDNVLRVEEGSISCPVCTASKEGRLAAQGAQYIPESP